MLRKFPLKIIISLALIMLAGGSYVLERRSVAGAQEHKQTPYLYEVYPTKAISDTRILPKTFPVPGSPGRELAVTACRGQYEPATFVIHALNPIKDLQATPTDLKSSRAVIPADAVDIRVVKCWFQAGEGILECNKRILKPELLLKNDKLVLVDLQGQRNYLLTPDASGKENYVDISSPDSSHLKDIRPQDAKTLQPVSIEVGSVKQFWIAVHVPQDAVPGDYVGKIQLTATNAPPSTITLRLRVLSFVLEKPAIRYSIYYRGQLTNYALDVRAKLTKDGRETISAEWKSPEEYAAEMANLKSHGIDYPTIYQPNPQLLRQELEIREKAGLPKGTLYSLTLPNTGNPTAPEQLEALKKKVRTLMDLVKPYGYDDVYVYGIDEATKERLISQRPAWTAVHEAGGKIFNGNYKGAVDVMGDLLDLGIIGGPLYPQEAQKYHKLGHQIFSRSWPVVGEEKPETHRRFYGLQTWQAAYDGVMNYAYQDGYGNIWNDFDHFNPRCCRDIVAAYPTVDGVIDTLQWEGLRAGIDDVRYLTTLLKAIRNASPDKRQVAGEAQAWVNGIDPKGDLDMIRAKMIEWIMRLQ